MHIVQIAPHIAPGSGVAGVAWNLEQQWRQLGHTVESFTLADLRRSIRHREAQHRLGRALQRVSDAVAFSISGTRQVKRFLADRPGAASVCHNGPLAGEVYVNHGVLVASMQARGHVWTRLARNPLHLFTVARDRIRYGGDAHRAVVALSQSESSTLRRVYGRVRPEIVVIPNGVDLTRFRPPSADERRAARAAFHLDDDDRVVLFIGHEFERKGLRLAIEALEHAPTVMLLVAGGNVETTARMTAFAEECGVAARVLFIGRRGDLPLMFAASDMFTLPSSYEANALVILEALASGVPVLATPVGFAPEVIVDGVNGALVAADPAALAACFERFASTDVDAYREACRASVAQLTWRAAAESYVALFDRLHATEAAK